MNPTKGEKTMKTFFYTFGNMIFAREIIAYMFTKLPPTIFTA